MAAPARRRCPAEPQVEVEHRAQAQFAQHGRGAGLNGAVAGDDAVLEARDQAAGDQQGGRRDHAVDHDRHLEGGGGGHEPRQRRVPARATDLGQDREGIGAVPGPLPGRRRPLPAPSCGAAGRRRSPSPGRSPPPPAGPSVPRPGRGGRRVGDAHVAGDQAAPPGGPGGRRPPRRRRAPAGPRRPSSPVRGSGPWWRHAPCAKRSGTSGNADATPTSTTTTSAPACRARTLMAAPPARKLPIICAVTSCGHGETPWACTPWSPANTATPRAVAAAGPRRQCRRAGCRRLPAAPVTRVAW